MCFHFLGSARVFGAQFLGQCWAGILLGFGIYQPGLSVGSTYYEELTSIKLGNRASACNWARQNWDRPLACVLPFSLLFLVFLLQ